MKIQLKELLPGSSYKIQVRVGDGDATSQWSKQFDLVLPGDNVAPSAPTGLSWAVNGTAFSGSWTKPTTSADGSALKDFKDYKITLTGGGNTVVYYTSADRFDLSFEDNGNAFGTPQATVSITVKSRDLSGNLSAGVSATTTNPPPAAPTGLQLSALNEAIALSWTAPADTDIKGYKVYQGTTAGFTADASSLKWTGTSTATVYPTIQYSTDLYFKVTAFDVFGSESPALAGGPIRPRSSFSVDTTAPPVPTGLAATITTEGDQSTSATVTWTAVVADDLQAYQIGYRQHGTTDWSYVQVDRDQTATVIDRLRPYVSYDFEIRAYDFSANYSAWSASITAAGATNTAPAAPTGVIATAGGTTAGVIWNANTETDVAFGAGQYEVQLDPVNTFNSAGLKDVKTSALVQTFTDLTPATAYYARVRAIDSLGLAGPWSATVTATPSGINGSVIITNTLAGDRVIANTLDAAALKANTALISDLTIKSALTIGDATGDGAIQSYGYVAGQTGFKLTKSTFEINQGSISAAALKLQLGSNMIPPQYATFIPNNTYYTSIIRGGPTWAIDQTLSKHSNGTSLKITSTAGQSITFNAVLNANGDNGNIIVEPGRSYIYSTWAYASVAMTITARIVFRQSTSTTFTASKATDVPANTWTRISTSGACPTGMTTAEVALTIGSAGTVNVDSQQFETQFGSTTTPSPWTPPGLTQIDGGIIRTGQIQSTSSVTVNGGTQPAWSINLGGSAQFGNALVRGTLIVGGSGDADQSYIASSNYVAGTSGWAIKSDGFAELQNLKVGAGQITDDEIGSISAAKITAGTISSTVLLSGTIATASTGARVNLDSTGLNVYDGSNNNLLSIASSRSSVLASSPTDSSQIEMKAGGGTARIDLTPPPVGGLTWEKGTLVTNNSDPFVGDSISPIATVTIAAPRRSGMPNSSTYRALLMLSSENVQNTGGILGPHGYMSRASLRANMIGLSGSIIREGNFPALFVDDVQDETNTVTVTGIAAANIKDSAMQFLDLGSVVFIQGYVAFSVGGVGTSVIQIGSFPRKVDRGMQQQNISMKVSGIVQADGSGAKYQCPAVGVMANNGTVTYGLDSIIVTQTADGGSPGPLVAGQITDTTLIKFAGFYFSGDVRGT